MGRASAVSVIDRRVLAGLSGRDKVLALAKEARGCGSIREICDEIREWPPLVSRNLHGHQHTPRVREKLAELVGLSVEELNLIIGEAPTTE